MNWTVEREKSSDCGFSKKTTPGEKIPPNVWSKGIKTRYTWWESSQNVRPKEKLYTWWKNLQIFGTQGGTIYTPSEVVNSNPQNCGTNNSPSFPLLALHFSATYKESQSQQQNKCSWGIIPSQSSPHQWSKRNAFAHFFHFKTTSTSIFFLTTKSKIHKSTHT